MRVLVLALLLSTHAHAQCSLVDLGDRIRGSVSIDVVSAFSVLNEAFEDPDLLHSPAFRQRLAHAMERAGVDAKHYLRPPSENGPIPSKALVRRWINDLKAVVACR